MAQVLTGFELLALREQFEIKPGPVANNSRQIGAISWKALIEKEMPTSFRTAQRWMQMAQAVHAKFPGLPGVARMRGLMDRPTTEWTQDYSDLLRELVEKFTTGKTQAQLVTPASNRPRTPARPAPIPTPAVESIAVQAAEPPRLETAQPAKDGWLQLSQRLAEYGAKFAWLDDHAVQQQIDLLEEALFARRRWIVLSPAERTPQRAARLISEAAAEGRRVRAND